MACCEACGRKLHFENNISYLAGPIAWNGAMLVCSPLTQMEDVRPSHDGRQVRVYTDIEAVCAPKGGIFAALLTNASLQGQDVLQGRHATGLN